MATIAINGGRGGINWHNANKGKSYMLGAIIFGTSWWAWHRVVGYNQQSKMEQEYAKNQKMLRNLIIRQ